MPQDCYGPFGEYRRGCCPGGVRPAQNGPHSIGDDMRATLFLSMLLVGFCNSLYGQLNENCIVSVLNRSVRARPDGTWVVPNIPANFGRVRARATCVENGVTRSGESDYFTLIQNQSVNIPPIILGSTTPIPTTLTLVASPTSLSQQNPTAQLSVTGVYANNSTRDLTASSTGTTYNISNSRIATITPEGRVTAVASGTVVVQAVNEGTQG